MRKLPLLLALLLLALLGTAIPTQAALLPQPGQLSPLLALEDDDEAEAEASEADEEGEDCDFEEEECDEEQEEQKGKRNHDQDDGCLLENAQAGISVNPGKRQLRLVVHYRAFTPAAVAIDVRLRGPHGRLRLGIDNASFRRVGAFRNTFSLSEKQVQRALDARELTVELRALNTPRYCDLDLDGAPRRAERSAQ